MQYDKGAKLRKEAESRKEKCKHPHIEKEYYLGAQTGDYICSSCGETHWNKSDFYK